MALMNCLLLVLVTTVGANASCSGADTCTEGETLDNTPVLSLLQSDMHVSKSTPIHRHGGHVASKEAASNKVTTADKGKGKHTRPLEEVPLVSICTWAVVVCLLLVTACFFANSKPGNASERHRYVAEFLGTFMLVFSVGCNVLVGSKTWGVTSIASTLMVLIYALAGVSGANFNPAVSFALGLSSKLPWIDVAIYMCVQLAAGICAGFSYVCVLGERNQLAIADGHNWIQAGLAELLYTFMLTFVVLNVACSKAHEGKNQFYGLAIGFTVVAGGYGAGAISGGCFNPAIALGIDSTEPQYSEFGTALMYIAFELLGGAMAAGLFRVCRDGENEDQPIKMKGKLTSEFIGTFMLVLTVGLNVLNKSRAGAFSIAASLMCMIFALGSSSGAHFNPAVTMAIASSGKQPWSEAVAYMVTQLLGGICAAFTYAFMMNGETVALGPKLGTFEALFGEFIFTFLLAFVVLSVAVVKSPLSEFFGLAIGACVIAGGYAIGNLSGGSLNPAVSAGLAFSDLAMNSGSIRHFFTFSAVELLGGLFAAATFHVTHPGEFSDKL